MRILQVSSAAGMGGGEVHVIDLCRALLERGHDVQLAVRPRSPLLERLSSPPVRVHLLPLRNALDVVTAWRLSRVIQRQEIDIIHGHVARDYLVCALAAKLSGRGHLILTRHHYLPVKRNWGYRRLIQQVEKFITVSESLRGSLIARLDLSPHQVVTIPNWVDMRKYHLMPHGAQIRLQCGLQQRYLIGMVGQITPTKGQEEFVRAAALVAASRDDVGFLVVGQEQDPRKRFAHHLCQLAQRRGLEGRLRMIDRVEDISSLLPALTLLVVPSWQEAFSLVLIQAMATGVPVIASNVGGPAEIVTHRVTGLLVPPRRVDALARAMHELLAQPHLRAQLAGAARREVEDRFEREKVIDRIEAVYRQVLASAPQRAGRSL